MISDSLKYSEAHFRWSTTGYSLPFPGKSTDISLDVKYWGVQSNCILTSISGSYVKKVHSIIGLSGLSALKPVLTLTSVSGGVRLTAKSTVDPKSYIVLHHGYASNESKKRIDSIKVYENPLSQPAVDSFAIINYIKSLYKEHTFYFADSGSPHQDTLKFNDVSHYDETKIINSHISMNGTFLDNILISSGTVYVHNTASITNSFIMAQKVIIDGSTANSIFYASDSIIINQGSHNSQFFSSNNILVCKDVKPGPYCTWIMLRTTDSSGIIHFLENKNLCGVAICVNDTNLLTYHTAISIDSGSVFKGYLFTNGYLMMQFVKIIGSVFTYSIYSYVNGTTYINYLYDVNLLLPEKELYFPLLKSKFSDFSYSEISSMISCY